MLVELSSEELAAMGNALERRIHEMYDELTHTDDREYREDVRSRLDALEALKVKLDQSAVRRWQHPEA